ncbi:MAG: S8 family serine peptidase [Candidatus Limnocylindria bacterium]
MSRAAASLFALLVLVSAAAPVSAAEPDPATAPVVGEAVPGEVVPGEVVVKYHDAAAAPAAAAENGLEIIAELGSDPDDMPLLLSTQGQSVGAVVAELNADPAVDYAEPNYVVGLAEEPNDGEVAVLPPDTGATAVSVNDPRSGEQYSLDRMQVRSAWGLSPGGASIVAVLDTGVQFDHPDLAGRLLEGHDFVNNDPDATDDNGHGTWVSGIIAANPNEGYGMAGISWNDWILPVKIMNGSGLGDTSDLTSGIIYAADRGATVINMSVGGFPYSQYVQDAVNYAWTKGAVLIGAAGNNRREETFYPASYANVVSVSATQPDDEFSNWSSYGSKVDVSAPGSQVLTTHCYTCAGKESWGTHTKISGTSFATPNVAGVVALIRGRFPSESPAQIVNRLFASVDDMGYPGWDNRYGLGRVNAARALGGGTPTPRTSTGDAVEPNNALGAATLIGIGTTIRPSIHPAGDVDVFAVDVPQAGRLDVRVTGVTDTARVVKNSLPVDPIVELYSDAGALLVRVDNEWESGVELASYDVAGPTRILIRVRNYYANGSPTAYAVTPSYVDTIAPSALLSHPTPAMSTVGRWVNPVVAFSEPVRDVNAGTVTLTDLATGALVPATVTYDAAQVRATLKPVSRLEAGRQYAITVGNGVRDTAGNGAIPGSWTITTGASTFSDVTGSAFVTEIEWLASQGITLGCGGDQFCPSSPVTREQMASFLTRAMQLPAAGTDYFSDDAGSPHQDSINRLASAGVTNGCGGTLFCPGGYVLREQMASFLARALNLPATGADFFGDDASSGHQADINRMAAAGVSNGCSPGSFCPLDTVTREQMAAFLYRAFGGT